VVRVCDANNNNNNNNNTNTTQYDIYGTIIYGAKAYAKVHSGSFERKSVSARWPPTRRPSYKLDLYMSPPVGCYKPYIQPPPFVLSGSHSLTVRRRVEG